MNETEMARMMRNGLLALCFLAVTGLCFSGGCGRFADRQADVPAEVTVVRDTTVIHDTVPVDRPYPVKERTTDTLRVFVPVAVTAGDSTPVDVPVVQREYADSLFHAWVSGPVIGSRSPELDSLHLHVPRSVVRETVRVRDPPRRWGISAGAGVTLTRHGVEPGVFIGATYTFMTF